MNVETCTLILQMAPGGQRIMVRLIRSDMGDLPIELGESVRLEAASALQDLCKQVLGWRYDLDSRALPRMVFGLRLNSPSWPGVRVTDPLKSENGKFVVTVLGGMGGSVFTHRAEVETQEDADGIRRIIADLLRNVGAFDRAETEVVSVRGQGEVKSVRLTPHAAPADQRASGDATESVDPEVAAAFADLDDET